MQKMYSLLYVSLIIISVSMTMSGCQKSDLFPVTGILTLDGKAVENATINFVPVAGGPGAAVAETDANGAFTLRLLMGGKNGAIPGDYVVTANKIESVDLGRMERDVNDPSKMVHGLDSRNALPEIYGDPEKSGLKATIVAGKNAPIELHLKSK